MSIILNIDTAAETAHISIAANGIVLGSVFNDLQNNHASFLQPAIKEMLQQHSIEIKNIDAIAVTAGPGSYTGMRVGMASAKGLCYALNKPLITLTTLEVLAYSAVLSNVIDKATLLCPMLDARRMEVYTAIYDVKLSIIQSPAAIILNENSFATIRSGQRILFFGSGAKKWEAMNKSPAAAFIAVSILPEAMSQMSYNQYTQSNFTAIAYSEPAYLKEFYTTAREL